MNAYYRWLKRNAVSICLLLLLVILYVLKIDKSDIKVLQCHHKNEHAPSYFITYLSNLTLNNQQEIETLVNDIEEALDYHALASEVNLFNHHYDSEPFYYHTSYLYPILTKSKEVYHKTQGAFDPTIAPYISLWQGYNKIGSEPSEADIWAISPFVSLDYIVVNETRVKKLKEAVTLNMNNLITSFQADAIANWLQQKRIKNFCIQLEDAVVAQGIPSKKKPWRIVKTIAHPDLEAPLQVHIDLKDSAMAIIDNSNALENDTAQAEIFIDPLTGYMVPQHCIVAFVFAKDCVTARSYATAFMAKHFTNALALSTTTEEGLEFVVIEKDEETNGIKYQHSAGLQVMHTAGATKVLIQRGAHTPPQTSVDEDKEGVEDAS